MEPDPVIELASQQHGVVALHQAPALGMSAKLLRARLMTSGWDRRPGGVFVRTGSSPTDGRRLAETVLACGPAVVLSHATAAAWWGLPGFDVTKVDVLTTRHSRRTTPARRVHVVDVWPVGWITTLNGIPVCRPELVVLQLCATVHPGRAERALDNAWSMRLLSGPSVLRLLAELGRSGRNGTALLRQLMDVRGPDYVPPASNVERRAHDLLAREGLGDFRRQVDSGGDGWAGRVDMRERVLPIIVEVQSERYHSALLDVEADRDRRRRLEEAGFEIVEVTETELFVRPGEFVERVRAARRRVLARSPVRGTR